MQDTVAASCLTKCKLQPLFPFSFSSFMNHYWVLKGDSFPNFLLTKDTLRSQWPGMVLNQWLLFCFVPFLALTTTLGLAIALCWLAASHFSVPTSCCFVPQIWNTIIIITFTTTTTNRPIRLTQRCTQFKSPGDKILCVLYLHYNVAFTFKWYGNSWNKTFYSQRVWIGYNIEWAE